MKIPYQFTYVDLTLAKLRELQAKLLSDDLAKEDVKLLDAILSYMAINHL